MNTFESLLEGLAEARVDYILVGGLAVELCGFTRATLDVDIIIEDGADNIGKLLAKLVEFGEGAAAELAVEDFTPEEGCVRVVEDFPLDIFTRMGGNSYHDLLQYSDIYHVRGKQIRYLAAEGLILLKKDSVRPKDQIDVDELRRILRTRER